MSIVSELVPDNIVIIKELNNETPISYMYKDCINLKFENFLIDNGNDLKVISDTLKELGYNSLSADIVSGQSQYYPDVLTLVLKDTEDGYKYIDFAYVYDQYRRATKYRNKVMELISDKLKGNE